MLVNWFFGIRPLGIYRATFDVANRIWFFSNTIGLVLFPKFVRMLASARERLQVLLPRMLSLSWIGYGVLAIAGALIGPTVLRVAGLPAAEYGALFVVLIGALSANAHVTTPYAFLLAAGRGTRAAALGLAALALLVATFLVALALGAGLSAVGWAWVVSQIFYAFVTDVAALRVLGVAIRPRRDAAVRVIIMLAVALAVLGQLGALPPLAAPVGVLLGILALLLGPHELRSLRASTAHA
jgi:O-antigen/teichoic acid export membrane protein